ncbi:glycosyltransferase [Xenococcus sp. PCC 7305]|uniref:glycosyltransferase n=1 Tax=Xenococcus sp. PCC 7305 TaxID=102125 RepID=UPI0002ABD420|nr:glycosyltransferase [Xenococcus sp. PCC 7305]ELS02254.1 glycosyltransferase [Xenococcus sp. PCC 7305]
MKIAILASGFLPVIDGVTVSGFYRLQKLSQWGHEVLFFCPDYSALAHIYPNWQDYTGNIFPGVRVVSLESKAFFVDFERDVAWGSYRQVKRELAEFQPDIIHVDEPERLFVSFWRLAGIKFARRHQIPCVGFFRTNFLEYLEDFFALPKPLLASLHWALKKIIVYVYNSYDVTLVSSTITRDKIIALGIKNSLYGNLLGFESEKFDPDLRQDNFFESKYGLSPTGDRVKLIFLGRLTPDKGWDFTLSLLPKLFQKIDKDKVIFLVVGDGETKEKIVNKLADLKTNFHLFGRIAPEDIPELLANCDLHVTTSEKETRGLTIVEAFASGIPVLAPRAGGVVENIQDGINGYLYEPGDENDFVEKLTCLVEDTTLRHHMGLRGRESIQDKYSWDNTIKNLVNIWQEQIKSKAKR